MRKKIFISKATPEDDEFVLWIAPRLESYGYTVFADILSLEPGDRWRKEVTRTLQDETVKMLLCCRDESLAKDGVQEEIGIALDLAKELDDPRFIIPLRLAKFKKLFGIGELQFQDFSASWADGLHELLKSLERQHVPRSKGLIRINPSWEAYRKRYEIKVDHDDEILTSNWLRISTLPSKIGFYEPTGAVNHTLLKRACRSFYYPAEIRNRGFFSFANPDQINELLVGAGKFKLVTDISVADLIEDGSDYPKMESRDARNMVSSMFREAWESYCVGLGLTQYSYSNQTGFHASAAVLPIGKKIPWGSKRRSSMLRNIAGGRVWQYGVSTSPSFWPYPHFKLKARVLFADLSNKEAGAVYSDSAQQHRLRRSMCKGWRNKHWHGRLMAYLVLISGGRNHISLPLSPTESIKLESSTETVVVPATTVRPDSMPEEVEESEPSHLGAADTEHQE